MAIDKLLPGVERISTPTAVPLPETDTSRTVVIEPYHVDLLPEYSYVSREYLISGVAAGESYCTRILLRCPADATKFTGFVVEEPSHLWGGTSIWRHINRWLMCNVDSQAPSALEKIKNVDPERYKDMHFMPVPLSSEFQENIPFVAEILSAASYVLRSGQLGLKATRIVLSGLSQTGGLTRRFVTHSVRHLRLPGVASGGAALPDLPGVKVIELLGEAEFPSVRFPCGVSGQQKATTHRRPDSDSFRLYEVAGKPHRGSRYASALDMERSFSNSFIYHAVFEAMERWTGEGVSPPPSVTIQTIGSTDEIVRDEHGKAVGGVRIVHTDDLLFRIVVATSKGRLKWYWRSEVPFDQDKLQSVYGSVAQYRLLTGKAIQDQVNAGFLLPGDAETRRLETIETVTF
ncbi:hypothetical protein B0T10DRAFT_525433 [Thelonectria olida]|uniref:Alpha/beta hydrolase domain-containing protein n=1 Tax=Thelonectria olida TaxID=1576542 RepID=A0A9P9AWU5_9HYPO|nr:hypothetical protein B0T10DRAFT_525433 [Thelonectria olida]